MAVSSDPAQRHREFASQFADVISQVQDWKAPTPVDGWVAADIPAHLIEWLPPVFEDATGIKLEESSVDPRVEPAKAWQVHANSVQTILDDQELAQRTITDGRFTGMQYGQMLSQIYVPDVFMHRWDLARSNDLDPQMDPDFCKELQTGMSAIEDLLRESGQFGSLVATHDGASPVEQLIAFIGRDPQWKPQPSQ